MIPIFYVARAIKGPAGYSVLHVSCFIDYCSLLRIIAVYCEGLHGRMGERQHNEHTQMSP
jgi:hypothetical protein